MTPLPPWPRYPSLYEINTWVWLAELSAAEGRQVTLGSVPSREWDALAQRGFDAVWLMGAWQRSPAGRAAAGRTSALLATFLRALPDYADADNVGSPFCVRGYAADEALGGPEGLAAAREELARRGIRLLLDFVPNHLAPDHPWVASHPEYFVRGSAEDGRSDPHAFSLVDGTAFARGRDPHFPPWPDVLQLNAFDAGLRAATRETLLDVASQCDGVRCSLAMLVLDQVFERTWGERAGPRPEEEYWETLIAAVKVEHPGFLFVAEGYWDLEWELLQQGFDYCYDKRLYDRLESGSPQSVWLHLCARLDFQARLLRFLENHDEKRAAALFPPEREKAAALTAATLPGARLFHDGQLDGRRLKVPIFLGRRPREEADPELAAFHRTLLAALDAPVFRDGEWDLCECNGWPDNLTHQNLVAWCWRAPDDRRLVVVNLSDRPSQARVAVPWDDLGGEPWRLDDTLSGQRYDRDGSELAGQGLFVDLAPWQCHFFRVVRARE